MSLRHYPAHTESSDVNPDVMATPETRAETPVERTTLVQPVTDLYVPSLGAGLILAALAATLVSAWAGIAPYVSPTFGLSADGTHSWTWNDAHVVGALIPGAVALACCLVVLSCVRRPVDRQASGTLVGSGLLLVLCGAWLSVFPVAWAVIRSPYFHQAAAATTLEQWLAFATGPGVVLAAFGALVIGRARVARTAQRLVTRTALA